MKSVVIESSFCAAQPCSTRKAKAPEDWRSLPQPRMRVNLTGDPESFLEPAPSCVLKSLGRCSLWRSPMLNSAPVSRSPALQESPLLEPAPDTHLSAIVHRARAGTTFPLTPALSPRERETLRPPSLDSCILGVRSPSSSSDPDGATGSRAARMARERTRLFPLPEGEG